MSDYDLAILTQSFTELGINKEQAMAQEINYSMLRLYVDTIPQFSGESSTLSSFISAADIIFATYFREGDEMINNYLIRVIQAKLVGRAQVLVGSRMELNTWNLIKDALTQCFGDQRNIECLEQDLLMARPLRNENSLDFGRRLQVLRSSLAQRIGSDTQLDNQTKAIHLRQYDQMSLRTFIRGLPTPLQSIIRLKSPNSLETAITYINEEENFQYSQNLFKTQVTVPETSVPKQQNASLFPKFQRPPPNSRFDRNWGKPFAHSHVFPLRTFRGPSQFHNIPEPAKFPGHQGTSDFRSQPIHIQPRQVARNYPTNSQVFGPPKNVFKPTGHPQPSHYQPEPMSTTSRNTSGTDQTMRTVPRPFNNSYRPNGPPNFIAEELYQIENDSNSDGNDNSFYSYQSESIDDFSQNANISGDHQTINSQQAEDNAAINSANFRVLAESSQII